MRIAAINLISLVTLGGLTLPSLAKDPIHPDKAYRFSYQFAAPQRPNVPDLCTYPEMKNPHDDRQTYIAPKPSLSTSKIDIEMEPIGSGAQSCIRRGWKFPPKFPPRFLQGNTSGFCKFSFTYNADGRAVDIEIIDCSHDVLAAPTLQAVKRWQWFGSNCSEENRQDQRQTQTMRYDLIDEDGNILPYP